MKKAEFLTTLRDRLVGLPEKKIDEYCAFFEKKIELRTKATFSEERAVSDAGSFRAIAEYAFVHTHLFRLIVERVRPKKKLTPVGIVLLILGSVLWIPLALLCLVGFFLFYLLLWLPAILMLAVTLGLFGSSGFSGYCAYRHFQGGSVTQAIFFIGCAAALFGLAALLLLLTVRMIRGCGRSHVKVLHAFKKRFIRKPKNEKRTLITKHQHAPEKEDAQPPEAANAGGAGDTALTLDADGDPVLEVIDDTGSPLPGEAAPDAETPRETIPKEAPEADDKEEKEGSE